MLSIFSLAFAGYCISKTAGQVFLKLAGVLSTSLATSVHFQNLFFTYLQGKYWNTCQNLVYTFHSWFTCFQTKFFLFFDYSLLSFGNKKSMVLFYINKTVIRLKFYCHVFMMHCFIFGFVRNEK